MFIMKRLLFSLILLMSFKAKAHNLIYQYAGEMGQRVFGYGYDFNEDYRLDIMYGYVPSSMSSSSINTYAIRNNFNIYQYQRVTFGTGITLMHVVGDEFKGDKNNVPENYYKQQSNYRLYLYYNLEYDFDYNNRIYFENGLNDLSMESYYNNSERYGIAEYMSMGLGYRYKFD